jgi:predicted RNase H-like HicB family nuclease
MSNEERFSINLRWSDVDEAYLAEVPELPGCIADGATRQ